MSSQIFHCPVCGHALGADYTPEELRLSFEICDCCGCEYGYSDNVQYFDAWVAEGCKWFSPRKRPSGWELDSQRAHMVRPWPKRAGPPGHAKS